MTHSAMSLQRVKKAPLLKPEGGSLWTRTTIVAGGLYALYTFAAAPIVVVATLAALASYFAHEIKTVQSPRRAALLKQILKAETPKIPSIYAKRRYLRRLAQERSFSTMAINAAIEEMAGDHENPSLCCEVYFKPRDHHHLAGFGSCFVVEDPDTGALMMPYEFLCLRLWQQQCMTDADVADIPFFCWSKPAIPVSAVAVEPVRNPVESIVTVSELMQTVSEPAVVPDSLPREFTAPALFGGDWQSPIVSTTRQTDLPRKIAGHLCSRVFCAHPRGGKGLTICTALDHIRHLRPDCELWALDIKAHPDENGYYRGFDSDKLLRVSLMGFSKPEGADDRIRAFFEAFNQSTSVTKLLWVNEVVTLATKLEPSLWKNIKDFAVGLCSAGSTGNDGQTGRFIWFDTQSPNVSDIGLKTNASRNVFRRVFLMKGDRSLLNSAISCGFASGIPDDRLTDLYATGSKVVAYESLSDEWIAMPLISPPSAFSSPGSLGSGFVDDDSEPQFGLGSSGSEPSEPVLTDLNHGSEPTRTELPNQPEPNCRTNPNQPEFTRAEIKAWQDEGLAMSRIVKQKMGYRGTKYQEGVAEYKRLCPEESTKKLTLSMSDTA